jgi:hypothetical protein
MRLSFKLFIAIFALHSVVSLVSCGRRSHQESELKDLSENPFWAVSKPGDERLVNGHSLSPYFAAAKAKSLPGNYFRDLIGENKSISLKYREWPAYQPGIFYGGTIYHPKIGAPFSEWKSLDWSSFYNELFHAWWGTIFTSSAKYAADRGALFTQERQTHYRRAHPTDPRLAQEEAYSETIATLAMYFYPTFAPDFPSRIGFRSLADFGYNRGRTVAPVSHSDRPGFTPEAESTWPNEAEYAVVFRQLFDSNPPN